MATLHKIHMVRGIGTSLVIAVFFLLYFQRNRSLLPPIPRQSEIVYPDDIPSEKMKLVQHSLWLIEMRWIIAGISTVVVIASFLLDILPASAIFPLLTCSLLVVASNIFFTRIAAKTRKPYRVLMYQIVSDLVILSGFIEFSGGIENPMYLLFFVHVTLAGLLLRRRHAFFITLVASALVCAVAFGQMTGILPHHTISLFPHKVGVHVVHASSNPDFVVGRVFPLIAVMFVIVYFVSLINEKLKAYEGLLLESSRRALSEVEKRRQAEDQLIQSSKLAAIGEFAGHIAHEINNPMGIIIGRLKLMKEDLTKRASTSKDVGVLDTVLRHAEVISNITRDLLTYSRPILKKREPVEINYLVKSALFLVDQDRIKRRIKINCGFMEKKIVVEGDFDELQRVLVNLINNAIEAISGQGAINIGISPDPASGVIITIEDTGSGIPKENISRIFEPFFTTKTIGKGTGLGLAIAAGIIKGHGGDIFVESSPGKGSKFTIKLPGQVAAGA